jgi:hypothetical protein
MAGHIIPRSYGLDALEGLARRPEQFADRHAPAIPLRLGPHRIYHPTATAKVFAECRDRLGESVVVAIADPPTEGTPNTINSVSHLIRPLLLRPRSRRVASSGEN